MKTLGILTGFILVLSAYGTALGDLDDGLAAHYPFQGNAADASGNGNNGTVHGASLTQDKDGNSDSAYYFDGNDYISVGHSDSLDITDAVSISAWVRSDLGDGTVYLNQYFVCKGASDLAAKYYTLNIANPDPPPDQADFVSFGLRSTSEGRLITGSAAPLLLKDMSPSEWYHFVGTWDGETMRIYKNGVHVPEADRSFLGPIESAVSPLNIGRQTNGTRYFQGSLDDIRIYSRALTESEVEELYCDYDSDGYYIEACGGEDCNDSNPNINPSIPEDCSNSIDDDCDGLVDLEDSDCCTDPIECDDNDKCTVDDCVDHHCQSIAINCDDSNECTDDSCDSLTGCVNTCNATGPSDLCCHNPACQGEPICDSGSCVGPPGKASS